MRTMLFALCSHRSRSFQPVSFILADCPKKRDRLSIEEAIDLGQLFLESSDIECWHGGFLTSYVAIAQNKPQFFSQTMVLLSSGEDRLDLIQL